LIFTAGGFGSLDSPDWTVKGQIADLYVGDEGVGAVKGTIHLVNEVLNLDIDVQSVNRLQLVGAGTIALNDTYDSNLNLRFTDTSIDPYLKFVAQEMPYTKAIVSGTLSVSGPLADTARLTVNAVVEKADITLFAYAISNNGDIRLSFKNNIFGLDQVAFQGAGTSLTLSGTVDSNARRADVRANGQANLEALQGFYPDVSAGGDATLIATLAVPSTRWWSTGRRPSRKGISAIPRCRTASSTSTGPSSCPRAASRSISCTRSSVRGR
jgi:hypothetical protein